MSEVFQTKLDRDQKIFRCDKQPKEVASIQDIQQSLAVHFSDIKDLIVENIN